MIDKIMKLDNIETFWDDVKKIVGFYDDRFLEDCVVKDLQRWADYRYEQLKKRKQSKLK